MPGSNKFGEETWDIFSRAQRADAYVLRPEQGGQVAGSTTFASSGRRDAQALHRIWAFLQDHETYGETREPNVPPVPEYLVRYGRGAKSVDMVLDTDGGYLSIYKTGEPEAARWISVQPAITELSEVLDHLFERARVRDLRPNL